MRFHPVLGLLFALPACALAAPPIVDVVIPAAAPPSTPEAPPPPPSGRVDTLTAGEAAPPTVSAVASATSLNRAIADAVANAGRRRAPKDSGAGAKRASKRTENCGCNAGDLMCAMRCAGP
jgi:hypothetical protein